MPTPGNNTNTASSYFSAPEIRHGKGVSFVLFFVAAIAITAATDRENPVVFSFVQPTYLDFGACLEADTTNTDQILCTARDNTSWQVRQTTGQILDRANTLLSAPDGSPRDTRALGSVLFTSPLVLTPPGVISCTEQCFIAGQDADGEWSYRPVDPSSYVAEQLDHDTEDRLLPIATDTARIIAPPAQ